MATDGWRLCFVSTADHEPDTALNLPQLRNLSGEQAEDRTGPRLQPVLREFDKQLRETAGADGPEGDAYGIRRVRSFCMKFPVTFISHLLSLLRISFVIGNPPPSTGYTMMISWPKVPPTHSGLGTITQPFCTQSQRQ